MSALTGTGAILGLNLRRDKIVLPVCVLTFAGSAAGSAAATINVFPDEASRVQGAELINLSSALVAMYGRVYDPTSLGALSVIKLIGMGTVGVALFSVLMVLRHTRADEELGRHELLAGGALGRFAPLAAALLVAVGGSVLIGLATAPALVVAGLPLAGSVAFGLTWAVAGLAFAGVGAVVAQLTSGARAARGLGVGALGVAFLLRAVGDATGDPDPRWPTWMSPIGWSQQVRPFAGDRWSVALIPALFGLVMIALAGVLLWRRDLGAGMLPQRPGAAHAGPLLAGPFGLAWRLQRAAFVGWLVGFVLLSLVVAQILPSIGDLLTSPRARDLMTTLGGVSGLVEAFIDIELSFVAVFASGYGISCALRLNAEESTMRSDALLSAPVSRLRWAASHLVIAFAGATALMLACGVTLGVVHAAQSSDGGAWGRDLVAAAVRVPAVWVLVGVAVALYGWSRRAAPMAWGVLAATFLASELGPLLDLPPWVRDLSPYSHVPSLPGGVVTAGPLLTLTAIAVALTAAGLFGLRRRDLAAG